MQQKNNKKEVEKAFIKPGGGVGGHRFINSFWMKASLKAYCTKSFLH